MTAKRASLFCLIIVFTNSKLEANQTEADYFSFVGTPAQAGAALQRAGFNPRILSRRVLEGKKLPCNE
jgi:hypothetical protein